MDMTLSAVVRRLNLPAATRPPWLVKHVVLQSLLDFGWAPLGRCTGPAGGAIGLKRLKEWEAAACGRGLRCATFCVTKAAAAEKAGSLPTR
jgi:hypothetical protein